ncbi:hypothetical protein DJ010_00825 [Nocardioides silvaticus]|uniref:Uncharacterized protein n=1 Tax=Nocardioides silvaticus TaxID=2201891 RepID=A0A316TKT0_9ACTN|nr:hypothetical protein [Nocardioides silvaticus]PWN04231.1 hypothetical protein DJ010_00825 [Nocardioides silvaticus]
MLEAVARSLDDKRCFDLPDVGSYRRPGWFDRSGTTLLPVGSPSLQARTFGGWIARAAAVDPHGAIVGEFQRREFADVLGDVAWGQTAYVLAPETGYDDFVLTWGGEPKLRVRRHRPSTGIPAYIERTDRTLDRGLTLFVTWLLMELRGESDRNNNWGSVAF